MNDKQLALKYKKYKLKYMSFDDNKEQKQEAHDKKSKSTTTSSVTGPATHTSSTQTSTQSISQSPLSALSALSGLFGQQTTTSTQSSEDPFSLLFSQLSKLVHSTETPEDQFLFIHRSFKKLVKPQISETNGYHTRYIKGHGVMNGKMFDIPSGVRIITLSELGTCPILDRTHGSEQLITDLYKSGKYLFQNEDASDALSEEGQQIERYLSRFMIKKTDEEVQQARAIIKNHIGPMKVNDIELSLTGKGCSPILCSIDCFGKDKPTILNMTPMWQIQDIDRKVVNDSNIPFTLQQYIFKEGPGTYIINACRDLSRLTEEQITILRDNSL